MRIAFDCDGTITEGKYLEPPRTREMYMGLAPYDQDTATVLDDTCGEHEVYIITARSDYRADQMILNWLQYKLRVWQRPTAIITAIPQDRKYQLVVDLKCDLYFDDSPNVFETFLPYQNSFIWGLETQYVPTYLVDNPHWPKNQQIATVSRLKSWKEINEVIHNHQSHQSQSAL